MKSTPPAGFVTTKKAAQMLRMNPWSVRHLITDDGVLEAQRPAPRITWVSIASIKAYQAARRSGRVKTADPSRAALGAIARVRKRLLK